MTQRTPLGNARIAPILFLYLALLLLGNPARAEASRQRIVSLGPILTGYVFLLGAGERLVGKPPVYAHNPEPPYPDLARRRGWQGTVLLLVRVLANGSPAELALSRSSGYELLDAAALRAVRGWRFQPGTSDGRTVAMEILVPVHFQLR